MLKKLTAIFIALTLSLATASIAFAADVYEATELPQVVDEAELLTDDEEDALSERIASIKSSYPFDILIITKNTIGDMTPKQFTDSYYDDNGYGCGEAADGIAFLLNMGERDWYISTNGSGRYLFDDSIQLIGDSLLPDLGDGNYYAAFNLFLDYVDSYLYNDSVSYDEPQVSQAPGNVYYPDYSPSQPYVKPFMEDSQISLFLILCLVGIIIALIIVFSMKRKMNTARAAHYAQEYIRQGSFNLTDSSDVFQYSHVSKVRIQTETNHSRGGGGGSHGGGSHGGGGGKF